jgi:hypothetical protein
MSQAEIHKQDFVAIANGGKPFPPGGDTRSPWNF